MLICTVILLIMSACGRPVAEPVDGITLSGQGNTVDILYYLDDTFEEEERIYRGDDGLTRNSVFGDVELQKAVAAFSGSLDLTKATHVLEYAYRLVPIMDAANYFNETSISWIQQEMAPTTICYYADGVWTIHYEEKADLPDNYEEMPEEERHNGNSYDGGVYVIISSSDGHIISLQDAFSDLIDGKTELSPSDEVAVPQLKYQPAFYIFLNDVSLAQHFTGWTGKKGEMYEGAPLEVSAFFADELLQETAMGACPGLELNTIEGMSDYAWQLGAILCNTEYQMSGKDFTVSSMTRYTDGAWEIHLSYPQNPQNANNELCHTYIYVSEEDGHIICMFDANGDLVV